MRFYKKKICLLPSVSPPDDATQRSEFDRLIYELEQCREDQRSHENAIMNVILIGTAIIGFICTLLGENDVLKGKKRFYWMAYKFNCQCRYCLYM